MNVVVPYTAIHPATAAATPGARRVYVGADDEAYWRLLRDLWFQARPFIIVEHDVVPPDGGLDELARCPATWCTFAYRVGGIWTSALGCTKFDDRIMKANPGVFVAIAPGQRTWNGLDGVVIGELHRRGYQEHVHTPWATHYHDDTETRRLVMVQLRWIGDGSRYIHEDIPAGIPATPPTDFETTDPVQIAVCLESGLYEKVTSADTRAAKAEKAAASAETKADQKAARNAAKENEKAVEAAAEQEAERAAAESAAAGAAVGHVPASAEA